VEECVVDVGT
jgi:hypothetical protein